MNSLKYWIVGILIISTALSCEERYYLNNIIENGNKIVVDALISDYSNKQQIILSKSSSPEEINFNPLSGCFVMISDDHGNEFYFEEDHLQPGHYNGTIEKTHFTNETNFCLKFVTSQGEEYESDFESTIPCPAIDTVYYEIENLPTADPNIQENGVQFFLDFEAPENFGRYFRIQLEETFEYHSTFPITRFIDENNVWHDLPKDYSLYTCYTTQALSQIFVLNTSGFSQNIYKKYSLHFVNDHTQRLLHGYSLLIKQYSLSETAYNFWNLLENNNSESGGIIASQPALVKGNVYNINNPKEVVLGYFGVSSVQTKRIFVPKVTELSFKNVPYCHITLPGGPLPDERPLYYAKQYLPLGYTAEGWALEACFDCTLLGGTTEKPNFWQD